ncbi:MAG: hypothetical protein A2X22_07775 [Bacteroidetes bacterium GWF2_49_14]|nr:MAG: hypothetical protein A2X22_07775 [Bacteroidetes bacterium GWF2_49_14]
MKKLQNSGYALPAILVALAVVTLYAVFRIPGGEGFNPSDDGVILAQSWRILQGEIPHLDFISLRPAGSGYMHVLDYFLPGPLEISSRWLVLIEYIIYSLLIAVFLMREMFGPLRNRNQAWLMASVGLISVVLNINHYNLFAWTTIDALFWMSVALFAWSRNKDSEPGHGHGWLFLAVSGSVMAALCRQTFALPVLVLLLAVSYRLLKLRSRMGWLAAASGLIPGVAYLAMILATGSLSDFVSQMTGRTEVWETGFVNFAGSFWNSPVSGLLFLALFTRLVYIWYIETSRKTDIIMSIINTQKYVIIITQIIVCFLIFIWPERLFHLSYTLFWLLIVSLVLINCGVDKPRKANRAALWILLVAWTSSISLGDNAPVFATGLLATATLLLILRDLIPALAGKPGSRMLLAGMVLLPVLVSVSVYAQKENNYRDLPSRELTADGATVFEDLKSIRLNPGVHSYLGEIVRIYKDRGSPQGRFAVWPNNPLVYRFLGSPDPFPLDWMQQPEFAGNEDRLMREVEDLLRSRKLVILVEKYNSKWIAREKIPLSPESPDYPYLRLLDSAATELTMESPWFRVYSTK